MPETRRTCYLIDGSAYIYRAFFGLPALSNSKGIQTNAVYGFTTMLMKILRERKPDCLAITFDEKGPTHRHEEFKERTGWSLYNAATARMKVQSPGRQVDGFKALNEVLMAGLN